MTIHKLTLRLTICVLLNFGISLFSDAQSNYTVSMTGSTSDFNAAEKISAASGNTDYYVTFDANNLYVAAFKTSGTFGSTDNFTVYLDSDPNSTPTSGTGTINGQAYNGVTGTLPFSANFNVHAEQSYQEARSEAGSWASTISGVTYNTGNTWREVSIPFGSIGNPDALYLSMWMGYTNGIFSSSPGADLGNGANPTVVTYIGGFGVSSVDCVPVNTTNLPVTASITNAVPASGITYGKVTFSSGSITATNNFNVSPGGSIHVSGGTVDLSGRTIVMGGATAGSGRGTTINYTSGTLISSATTAITFNGEGLIAGSALTFNGAIAINRKFTPLTAGGTTLGASASLDIRNTGFVNSNPLLYSSGSSLKYNTGGTFTASTEWNSGVASGNGVPSNVIIGDIVANSVLSFGASGSYRQSNGDVTISNATSGNGLILSSVSGGDLRFAGNLAQNGALTNNARALIYVGTSTRIISASSGTLTLDYLVLNAGANNLQIGSSTNLVLNGNTNALQFLGSTGGLDLNQRTVTLNGGGTILLNAAGVKNINSTGGTGTFVFAGGANITATTGTLVGSTNTRFTLGGTLTISAASAHTVNGTLQINSGGSIASNAPLYGASSTLIYNTGSTFMAGVEWTANATSGAGVPQNVTIGNGSNTTLNFGTSAQYRQANGNVFVSASSGLTLSTISGGDLHLRGDFTQNGTLTHNTRAVTFNGTNAQSILGSALNTTGTTNNFPYLLINNTSVGGVTFNTDVLVSQTSGNTLQLLNSGPLNIAATRTLTVAGTGGNIFVSSGVRVINFDAATSLMTISGSKVVTSAASGTLSFTSTSSFGILRLTAGVNFGATLTTIGNNTYLQINSSGSVTTNAPTYATGSTLVYNQGATPTVAAEWTTNSTSAVGVPHHVLIGNGTNTTLSFGATVQFRHANGNITISPSSGLTLSSAAGGNLQLRGDFSNAGTFIHSSRDVTFIGAAAQQRLTGATTFQNLILNNSFGLLLNSSITVANVMTLTAGSATLGINNITLSSAATGAITGTFSSTRMIITDGTGQLIRAIATAGLPITYAYPIGETTGTFEYSPVSFVPSANSVARNVGFRVIDGDHPQLNTSPTQTDYISRYWPASNSAAGNYTYTASFTYVAADLNGSESNVRANLWNGTTWLHAAGSSSASNVLSVTTAVTQTTGPIGATAEFTGRVNNGSTYTWNVGNGVWTTPGNWTPLRTTPTSNDILIFNNSSVTASGVITETIAQLIISGTSNVVLTPVSANRVLTISGGNGTDLSIASTAALSLTNANATTIQFSNSTVAAISGTLTLSGSTANTLDCTNSVVSVTGSINSFGTITSTANNLNFASTGNYRHNYTTTAGVIPLATWDAASTLTIQGYTSNNNAPSNLNQGFGNVTWNCASQGANIALAGALNNIAGNFTISATNGARIDLADANATINVGGNMTINGANTTVRLANSNGTYMATLNVAGGYNQSVGTSLLALNNGNAGTTAIFKVGGNFNCSAGTISQTSGGTAGNLIEWNGSTSQAVTIAGTLPGAGIQLDYRLNNTAGMVLTGAITVRDQSTFYRSAGAITGTGPITYFATGTTLVYEGTTAMTTGAEFPSSNGPENVAINSTNTITLFGPRSLPVTGVFTNTSGIFALGSNDFTISNNSAAAALINTSPSATNMIAAGGSGQLLRAIAAPSSATYLFPIGDITGTAEYSGIQIQFASNTSTRTLGFRVADGFNVNDSTALLPAIDYTSRTWYSTLSSTIGSYAYTPTLFYNGAGDVYGTENNMLVSNWTGAAWVSRPSLVTSGSPTSNIATTATVSNTTLSLNNAEIMGRAPIKYWTGNANNQWSNGANWVPSGVPISTDNIDISFFTNFPCLLSSGSVTINHLTLSGTGNFTLSSGASLTVAGNFTYDNPAAAVFNCGSSMTLNNNVYPQTIPAINFGSLNIAGGTRILAPVGTIGICNDYTPTSGSLTNTGSSVNFNGTTTQSILTNTTSFNNLTVSNTGGNINSGFNVTINGIMLVNQNARFNNTAGNFIIASGASASVSGFLRSAGSVVPTGSLTITSTGTYEHNTSTPGTIPIATWNTGSTCELIGSFSSGNLNCQLQNFHHFKVNYSGSNDVDCNGTLNVINGDFTCHSTGTGIFIFASADITVDILGNFAQTGGNIYLSNGNNNSVLIILLGNYSQSAGAMDFATGNSNADGNIDVYGNYSRTGNGTIITSGNNNNGVFSFKGVTQTLTETSSGQNKWNDYDITSGSTTSLLSNLLLEGTGSYVAIFDVLSGGILNCGTFSINGPTNTRTRVQSGSTIRTANVSGLMSSGASGSVQTVTRTFDSGATYEYNGTVNQNTGTFFTSTGTANTVANLTFSNTGSTVTLNSGTSPIVTGTLNFTSTNSANFNVGGQTIYVSNTATNAVTRTGSGHVIGNLRRAFNTGTNTYEFQVGGAINYAPASLAMVTSASGSLTVRTIDGVHPNAASNGMSQTSYVNRYWTVTANSGTLTSNASTFTYDVSDIVGGATAATLRLKRYSAGWTAPAYTSVGNDLTASTLTNTTTYGDFFAAADCSGYLASITPSASTTFCNGGSVNLAATTNIVGSTYVWSPATGLSSTTAATPAASPSSTITYTVTATSPQSCVDTETITVTIRQRPTGVISGNATICNGGSTTLSIAVTGTGPWSGTLSSGAAISGATSPLTISVSPSTNTTYTIATLSDANCASIAADRTGSAAVNVNARPTGVISGNATICNGGSTTLSIAVTGTGPWSGTLSSGVAISGATSPLTISVSPSTNTTYTIATLSDANCASLVGNMSGSAVVNVVPFPTAYVIADGTLCYGDSTLVIFGGTPNATVTYNLNGGPNQNLVIGAGGATDINSGALFVDNTYSLISVNNGVCNPGLSSNATIYVNAELTAGISGTASICDGSSSNILFTGSPNATVVYIVNGGANQNILLDGSGNASLNSGSVYETARTYALGSVILGDCSRSVSGSAIITTLEIPEASVSGIASICTGQNTNITFNGTPGATATYDINNGADLTVLLNGSGLAIVNTGSLTSNASYRLISVAIGGCVETINTAVLVTVLSIEYFEDADADGFGDPTSSVFNCVMPMGYVLNSLDCEDTNSNINPNTVWYADIDGDGYGSYIYATQCTDPLIVGVVILGGDCNDNNPSVYPANTEVCGNGIDDDCDGFVDEGCFPAPSNDSWAFALTIPVSGNVYPSCQSYSGTTAGATVSPQSSPSNVLTGEDVWYKFQTTSSGVRISLTNIAFDGVVQLYNNSGILVEHENVTGLSSNEFLNVGSLTAGSWYYVAIRNYNSALGFGTFNLCLQRLAAGSCAGVSGSLVLCANFKPVWTGANQYITTFTSIPGGAITSYASTGQFPLSVAAAALQFSTSYSSSVAAIYNLTDGAGMSEVINVQSLSNCSFTIAAQPNVMVKESQTCPTVTFRNSLLHYKPFVCGAIDFEIRFTRVNISNVPIALPFTILRGAPIYTLHMSFGGPNQLVNGGRYLVEVRPIMPSGSGVYGTPQCITLAGSAMEEVDALLSQQPQSKSLVSDETQLIVYPNPTSGNLISVALNNKNALSVEIRIFDSVGKVIRSSKFTFDGTLNVDIPFENKLTNGLYTIEFRMDDGSVLTKRFVVSR